MKIVLIIMGKTEKKWLQQGLDEYIRRLGFYIPFEIKIVPDLKNNRNLSKEQVKIREGELLFPFIEGKNEVYLLDEKGEDFSSREFAGFVERKMNKGCKELMFVIGGPYGFSESAEKKATGKISLSRLTFSHQMVRLLFMEQLYRALQSSNRNLIITNEDESTAKK